MKKEIVLLLVDGDGPYSFEEFYSANTSEEVEPLTEEEFQSVKNLKVGESLYFGMGVEVRRVK